MLKLASILASLGLATPIAAAPTPPSAVRNTARILLVSCETAIRSGAWTIHNPCGPNCALSQLDVAMLAADEQEIAEAAARVAATALDAIATGEWMVDGDSLAAIIDASTPNAANDAYRAIAA